MQQASVRSLPMPAWCADDDHTGQALPMTEQCEGAGAGVGHLRANGLHALNLLKPLPLLLFSQESQQAAQALLTLAVIQLIQVIVPACVSPGFCTWFC